MRICWLGKKQVLLPGLKLRLKVRDIYHLFRPVKRPERGAQMQSIYGCEKVKETLCFRGLFMS